MIRKKWYRGGRLFEESKGLAPEEVKVLKRIFVPGGRTKERAMYTLLFFPSSFSTTIRIELLYTQNACFCASLLKTCKSDYGFRSIHLALAPSNLYEN